MVMHHNGAIIGTMNQRQKHHTRTINAPWRLTVRLPSELRAKAEIYVDSRQARLPKYSLNDCLIEAMQGLVGGIEVPVERTPEEIAEEAAQKRFYERYGFQEAAARAHAGVAWDRMSWVAKVRAMEQAEQSEGW